MSEIKKGDIVRLKSGGPNMTVHEVMFQNILGNSPSIPDGALCIWFDGKKLMKQTFDKNVLEKVDNTATTTKHHTVKAKASISPITKL